MMGSWGWGILTYEYSWERGLLFTSKSLTLSYDTQTASKPEICSVKKKSLGFVERHAGNSAFKII